MAPCLILLRLCPSRHAANGNTQCTLRWLWPFPVRIDKMEPRWPWYTTSGRKRSKGGKRKAKLWRLPYRSSPWWKHWWRLLLWSSTFSVTIAFICAALRCCQIDAGKPQKEGWCPIWFLDLVVCASQKPVRERRRSPPMPSRPMVTMRHTEFFLSAGRIRTLAQPPDWSPVRHDARLALATTRMESESLAGDAKTRPVQAR